MVAMRAARPDADEARPAAVGKLFSEAMCNGYAVNLGSEASRDWRRSRGVSQCHRLSIKKRATRPHLEGLAQVPELGEAAVGPPVRVDLFLVSVEPEAVGTVTLGDAPGRGEGAEVVLREGDRQGRVGRQDELGVALAPAAGRV